MATGGNDATLGALLGLAIGSAFGPGGALKGMQIGASVGSLADMITARPNKSLGNNRGGGATYTTARIRGLGANRSPGLLWWALKNPTTGDYTTDHIAGKKNGSINKAHASFAFEVCQSGLWFPDGTKIERAIIIDRIWMADICVWQNAVSHPLAAWSGATQYDFAAAITGSDNRIYTSLQDFNTNHDPTVGANQGVWWQLAQTNQNINIAVHPGPSESTFTMAIDSFIQSSGGCDGNGHTWARRGSTYVVVQDMDLSVIGNQIPWNSIVVEWHTATTYTDAEWISDTLRLNGLVLADLDVTLCTRTLTGKYVQAVTSGISILGDFLTIRRYDEAMIDGVVRFVPRGTGATLTIPDGDLSASTDITRLNQRAEVEVLASYEELPTTLHLKFWNSLDNFNLYMAPAQLNGVQNNVAPIEIDSGMTMTPDEALQAAGWLLETLWLEGMSGEPALFLPSRYSHVTPTDCPSANDASGKLQRYRVTKREYQPALVQLKVVRDEKKPLVRYESAQVIPLSSNNGQNLWLLPGTAFRVASPLIDIDDQRSTYPGVYVWACGVDGTWGKWKGCDVYLTWDAPGGSRTWIPLGSIKVASYVGQIWNDGTYGQVLANSSTSGFDSTSSTIWIPDARAFGFISSALRTVVEAGAQVALIGAKEFVGIINTGAAHQFRIAIPQFEQQLGAITFGGNGLIRCWRGSDGTGHALGEQFMMAPTVESTTKFKVDPAKIGATAYIQCCQPGQTPGSYPEQSCVIAQNIAAAIRNNPPVAPNSLDASARRYQGTAQQHHFVPKYNAPLQVHQTYNYQFSTSTDNITYTAWSSTESHPADYLPPTFTSGYIKTRVQAQTVDGRTSAWVESTAQAYVSPGTIIGASGYVRDTFTGDGATTAFTLTHAAIANSEIGMVDEAVQRPSTDYTMSGTTLTFVVAPDNGAVIDWRYASS